jgi:hypothetical protein
MDDGTLDMCIPAHKLNVSVERSQNSQGGGGGPWFLNKIKSVPPLPPCVGKYGKVGIKISGDWKTKT